MNGNVTKEGIKAEITLREKHVYSIYRRLERKSLSAEQVYDRLALRVFVDTVGACYQVLGLKERATTSAPERVDSFEQVLNDFKASYFAGALLINRQRLLDDLREFFALDRWQQRADDRWNAGARSEARATEAAVLASARVRVGRRAGTGDAVGARASRLADATRRRAGRRGSVWRGSVWRWCCTRCGSGGAASRRDRRIKVCAGVGTA